MKELKSSRIKEEKIKEIWGMERKTGKGKANTCSLVDGEWIATGHWKS